MGSGVTVNLVLAFLLFGVVFIGYGVMQPSTTVRSVAACVKVVEADKPAGTCAADDPASPALTAGLEAGDRILSFNGTEITSYGQLQRLIRANDAGSATIVVDRSGQRATLHTNTAINTLPGLSDHTTAVQGGFLGITPTEERARQGVGYVVDTMATGTWDTVKVIGSLPNKLYHVSRAALGLEERDPNSLMSVVGAGRVAGEVASTHEASVAERFAALLLLLGGLNLFLGLINLVPLPPFDGAGIATTLYEEVRRRIARIRGRPDPGPVDGAKLLPVTYAMAAVILVVSVVLIYADLVAPVSLS
jgi:membrane-associated protease RseP (regulator of RpoE activity)